MDASPTIDGNINPLTMAQGFLQEFATMYPSNQCGFETNISGVSDTGALLLEWEIKSGITITEIYIDLKGWYRPSIQDKLPQSRAAVERIKQDFRDVSARCGILVTQTESQYFASNGAYYIELSGELVTLDS